MTDKIHPPPQQPCHENQINRCHFGDALEVLRRLPDSMAQVCVTSPPYWGLRDYGTATWTGGRPGCDHAPDSRSPDPKNPNSTSPNGKPTKGQEINRRVCHKCGASRKDSQIGHEETPEEYVARLAEVFREVRRVLAHDGTLWLNLGDSYAGSRRGGAPGDKSTLEGLSAGHTRAREHVRTKARTPREAPAVPRSDIAVEGLKPKDLVGIPWMVAFALRADGWYLRQDIVWSKPNPMPESVRDRCTKAHEYLFLLSKSPRYYFDAEAIQEPATERPPGNTGPTKGARALAAGAEEHRTAAPLHAIPARETRNRRSVWPISTQPYAGAHFAVMPSALVRPCILAGSRPGDVVLDPFLGSGTVAQVAQEYGRQWVGVDLNPANKALQDARVTQIGMF
jgi:DNA modification methylase